MEEIDTQKKLIKGAMEYFYRVYNNDFDHTVYETVRIKVDFIRGIISKKTDLNEQLRLYKMLFERLYETGYRLKTDFDNVNSIISPLKTMIETLVREQADFLRETVDYEV